MKMRKKIRLSITALLFLCWFSLFFVKSFPAKQLFDDAMNVLSSDYTSPEKVELVVWGDIMLSRWIGRWAKNEGYGRMFSWENYNPLSQFPCYSSGTCLLYFNLESMFSAKDNDQPKAGFLFRSNTGNIQTLLDLQANNELVLSLANNHTNNAGAAGVSLTRQWLSAHEIGHFWAGNVTWEAEKIYKTQKNWIQFCFQAFSYDGRHGKYGGAPLARNPLNIALMTGILETMKQEACDVKVLGLHRGAEYRIKPNALQRELAHQLIDAGADILLGGHSHVPWSYEIYNGKPIFYSFGNFIFDQDRWKKATKKQFDYIYDYELKRKTVPTYLPLLVELEISKTWTGIQISSPNFKMARIQKGLFFPLDPETFSGIINQLVL